MSGARADLRHQQQLVVWHLSSAGIADKTTSFEFASKLCSERSVTFRYITMLLFHLCFARSATEPARKCRPAHADKAPACVALMRFVYPGSAASPLLIPQCR